MRNIIGFNYLCVYFKLNDMLYYRIFIYKLLNIFILLFKRCVNYSIFYLLKRWKLVVNEMFIFSLLFVIIYY